MKYRAQILKLHGDMKRVPERELTYDMVRDLQNGDRPLSSLTDKQLRALAHGFPNLDRLTDEQLERVAAGEDYEDVMK
jgi:hypothetical protein